MYKKCNNNNIAYNITSIVPEKVSAIDELPPMPAAVEEVELSTEPCTCILKYLEDVVVNVLFHLLGNPFFFSASHFVAPLSVSAWF